MLQSAQKDPSRAVISCSHHYCHNGQVQQPSPKMLASVAASSPLTTCDGLEIEFDTKLPTTKEKASGFHSFLNLKL